MAIGNEADTPTFSDPAFFRTNNGKKQSNAVPTAASGFGMIQFDRRLPFNPSSTPLSAESRESKARPGQLARRNATTIQPAPPQHSGPASPIDVCNRAKERLDASARDHRPWALITTDERGNAQAILSNSRDEGFLQKMQQVFHSNKLTSSLLQANEFNPGLFSIPPAASIAPQRHLEESFSVPQSRRSSAFEHPQAPDLGPIRVGKRGASSFDQDSPSFEDDDQQCNVVPTVTLTLGAADAVLQFFTTTFKAIQQQALKQILKAWIKELEPHKQKHHPYKGKILPPYWPAQVAFVEPDHQRTEDRIAVAIHIIKFVQADQKWTSINGIDTLESSTNSIKLQFDDEPQEKFHKRKILLKQLYDVARQQSLVLKDEKDGDVPMAFQDPMETMRIKRQPRAKRQKTCATRDQSEACEPFAMSQSESPDMSGESFVGSSAEVSPTSTTPMHGLSPPYAGHFQPESEQPLPTPQHPNGHWDPAPFGQHRANTPHQWNPPDFNHQGNIHHQMPYSMPSAMSQQTFPFTLPGCSPSAGQAPTPTPFESSPTDIEQYYTNQTQSPTHMNFSSISLSHGLGPASDVKMNTQVTPTYNAWIGEPHWDATPGSYNPQYQQPNTQQHPQSYQ
ncbi:hypothetical protein BLS_002234 [Venturia inaequalis]|uniref:Subtelomeric hrmA-associated cluster protein AFUB-079030/YDR124W-like helical bundle domain-containing protein n=1 Tax=Venturia inaequalis TaxID=5025 RepID=A0A8H3Z9L8_VENIN|nr:hypothetical protein EG328_004909 [Venturia inaequalis]KAE9976154.1 hypothetical protein BLS_002234 [Venturia inaequalis]KAE9985437.1 hypothetical protein EG327_004696 [Venturia inaequalis]